MNSFRKHSDVYESDNTHRNGSRCATTIDPLRVYLEEIGERRLLDQQSEALLAKIIADTHDRYRRAMLCNDYVLRYAVELLKGIRDRKCRLDSIIQVPVRDVHEKSRINALIPDSIQNMERLLSENQNDFSIAIDKNEEKSKRMGAWRRLLRRRREAMEIIERVQIKTKHVQSGFQELAQVSDQWSENMQTQTTEHSKLMEKFLETPDTLAQRVQKVRQRKQDFEEARDMLIQSNLRLVVFIAKGFVGRGVDLEDLIQVGNAILIQAVRKFDPAIGKFSTYAKHWIRKAMLQEISEQGSTIRMSRHTIAQIKRVNQVIRELTKSLGREPMLSETADRVCIPPKKLKPLLLLAQSSNASGAGEIDFGTLVDHTAQDPGEVAATNDQLQKVRDAINERCTRREREVLALLYDTESGLARTLEEAAKILDITKARIGQIRVSAFSRLTASLQ